MKEVGRALFAGLLAAVWWPWACQAQTPGAAILKIDIAHKKAVYSELRWTSAGLSP
jgi:hypothetical protein